MRLAGWHAGWAGALAAMAAGIVALGLASLPLALAGRLSQVAAMQAGLAATVIHMMVLVTAAAIVIFGHLPIDGSFIFWLMAVYVITLAALVACITNKANASATGRSATP